MKQAILFPSFFRKKLLSSKCKTRKSLKYRSYRTSSFVYSETRLPPRFVEKAKKEIDGADPATLIWNTNGLKVKPVYTREDVAPISKEIDDLIPGEYPFTRGPYTTMYTSKPWTVRQLSLIHI
eukprot:TRINITY_DN5230_c0_g1_i1.p1 TRINITY_DN5230_c0_g1~~TRINITY_DN5230_c0_g1_i1.p1  ORF type:complete len:123 (+),score=16.01 TRINITY_DN5230_c0_g1_i1:69-437(+)